MALIVLIAVLGSMYLSYKYGYETRVTQEQEVVNDLLLAERKKNHDLSESLRKRAITYARETERAIATQSNLRRKLNEALRKESIDENSSTSVIDSSCLIPDDVFGLLVESQNSANHRGSVHLD